MTDPFRDHKNWLPPEVPIEEQWDAPWPDPADDPPDEPIILDHGEEPTPDFPLLEEDKPIEEI